MSRFVDTGRYLSDDTTKIMWEQRADEQAGKRRLARVHALEHDDTELKRAPELGTEAAPENDIPQHPYLDRQLFDGADPNINIDPRNNPQAEMELENAEREQQLEHQHRLGLQPGMGRNKAPTPGSTFGM